jgi:hypothetical protein
MSRPQQSKKANTSLTHACPGAAPQGEAQKLAITHISDQAQGPL